MARDTRTYVRINDGLPDNPKILDVGDLAGWLYVCGLCYCSRQLTDGVIPVAMVGRLTGLPGIEALASALLEANLWHAPGHECKRCPQPLAGTYVVHDYLEHQRSAAEVRDLSEKRAAAGQKGGKASGVTRRSEANSEASATANAKQAGSKNEAETDTDTDTEGKKTSSSSSRAQRGTRIPANFAVTDDMVAWARENAPNVDGRRETERFINYWRGVAGGKGVKLDWVATWRNWLLKAEDDAIASGRITNPAAAERASPRPPHCGKCDPNSRMLLDDDWRPIGKCPDCHPLTQKASTT